MDQLRNNLIVGVKVWDLSREEIMGRIRKWISLGEPRILVSVGPEFLVTANHDRQFKEILNSADLAFGESSGLQLLAGFKNRVPGIELLEEICREGAKNGWAIGLLGGREGVAGRTKAKLEAKFPGLKINYALDGEQADQFMRHYEIDRAIINPSDKIIKPLAKVDILFAGLGHPKQEKFLWQIKNGEKKPLLSYVIGFGVGGSFDFISGEISRPPKWMRDLGLGWLFRGMTKPGHWRRIWKATGEFFILYLRDSLGWLESGRQY